jgi:Flp pilus assembly protein TadD
LTCPNCRADLPPGAEQFRLKAAELLTRSKRLCKTDAGGLPGRATSPAAIKLCQQAKKLLLQSFKEEPDSIDAHNCLGHAHLQLSECSDALCAFEKLVALAPDSDTAHCNLGIAREDAGDCTGAAASFRRALKLNPDDVKTNYNFALMQGKIGDDHGAVASYQSVIRLSTQHNHLNYNLGM